jgi:hypothetical protein
MVTDQKWEAVRFGGDSWVVVAVDEGKRRRTVCECSSEADARLIAAAPALAALLGGSYTGGDDRTSRAIEAAMNDVGGPLAWRGRVVA